MLLRDSASADAFCTPGICRAVIVTLKVALRKKRARRSRMS